MNVMFYTNKKIKTIENKLLLSYCVKTFILKFVSLDLTRSYNRLIKISCLQFKNCNTVFMILAIWINNSLASFVKILTDGIYNSSRCSKIIDFQQGSRLNNRQ